MSLLRKIRRFACRQQLFLPTKPLLINYEHFVTSRDRKISRQHSARGKSFGVWTRTVSSERVRLRSAAYRQPFVSTNSWGLRCLRKSLQRQPEGERRAL